MDGKLKKDPNMTKNGFLRLNEVEKFKYCIIKKLKKWMETGFANNR